MGNNELQMLLRDINAAFLGPTRSNMPQIWHDGTPEYGDHDPRENDVVREPDNEGCLKLLLFPFKVGGHDVRDEDVQEVDQSFREGLKRLEDNEGCPLLVLLPFVGIMMYYVYQILSS